MVQLLNYVFQTPKPEHSEWDDVLFINDLALDFPDTAYATLLKESKHLYNNVFEIKQGLSVTKEDVTSGMELEDIIKMRNHSVPVDMNEFYEKRMKISTERLST